jgi:hypothetical protein
VQSAWNEIGHYFHDAAPLWADINDVCSQCVADKFSGWLLKISSCFMLNSISYVARLFEMQHPRLVNEFDQVCSAEDEEPEFWISREWLKGTDMIFIKFTH